MKRITRKLRIAFLLGCSGILAVFFQNCGKAGFDNQNITTVTDLTSTSTVNFAFDGGFDTVAYNSCASDLAKGRSNFWTFKAGAYVSQGIWERDSFKDYAKNSGDIKPDDTGVITNDQIKIFLSNSIDNMEARPQMAIRVRDDVQKVVAMGAEEAAESKDYVNMLGDLTDDRWMDPLINKTGITRFFDLAPSGQRVLEGQLSFNDNLATADTVRNAMVSRFMMTMTFAERQAVAEHLYQARTPDALNIAKAFGRGYLMNFNTGISPVTAAYAGTYNVAPHPMNPPNMLMQVSEVDLTNPAVTVKNWSCSQARIYTIMRSTDFKPDATHPLGLCPKDTFDKFLDPAFRSEYEIVRRLLPDTDWEVSVTWRCAYPKPNKGECYKTEMDGGNVIIPQYDQRTACYNETNPDPSITRPCAQYVSICTRE